jgi:dienelactone hydrolase
MTAKIEIMLSILKALTCLLTMANPIVISKAWTPATIHRSIQSGSDNILLKLVYDDSSTNFDRCRTLMPVALLLSGADCPHESYMWLATRLAREGFCVMLSSCVVAFGPTSCLLSLPFDLSMLSSLEDYKKGPSSAGIDAILQDLRRLSQEEAGPLCGKLDLSKIVVGGHSSGGRTALDLVAFENPFPLSAVFTYGASLVNSGLPFVPKGTVLSCDASNPPPLLMLGGSHDGVSAKLGRDNDATETLRRTMEEAFADGKGDADLILLKGYNHMVACSPIDPGCGAVRDDGLLLWDGDYVREVLGGIIVDFLRSRGLLGANASSAFQPKIPVAMLYTTKSVRTSSHPPMAVSETHDPSEIWNQVSSTLDRWISRIVKELGLQPSNQLCDSAKTWTAGPLSGSLEGWESPSVAWAVRYANSASDGNTIQHSLGWTVWLAPQTDAPHLTIYVGIRGSKVTLMADHLPRNNLVEHMDYVDKYYGGEQAALWLKQRSIGASFASADPTIRALQGPNALAMTVQLDREEGEEAVMTRLVEALNNHCDSWLQFVRGATSLSSDDEIEAVAKRDLALRHVLRNHERAAGERFMDAEFASFLANCMAGMAGS